MEEEQWKRTVGPPQPRLLLTGNPKYFLWESESGQINDPPGRDASYCSPPGGG